MRIKVDVHHVEELERKLQQMSSRAFPNSVRNALNNAAFETKKKIPQYAQREFTTRNKGLFKAFVSVNKAAGNNISTLQSEVGVFNSSKNQLANDLSQQEIGGTVKNRGLIAMNPARISNSDAKQVKKINYLSNVKISPLRKKKGTGTGFVIIKKNDSSGTVFSTKKKNKLTPVYSFKRNRKANLKRKPFIQPVALIERNKIPEYFVKAAERMLKNR